MAHIRLLEPDMSKYQDYRIKDFGDLTIADWYTITNPPIAEGVTELEASYELIQRWAAIPKAKLRRMRPADVELLMSALGKMLGEATKAKMDEFTPEATFTHDGITYTVPQNVEAETTFGQWADLNARLEGLTVDADMLPVVLACLLVEEGKDYDGADLDARIDAMRALPAAYALKLTAFFFASGTRLPDVMNRYLNSRLMYALQQLQQELTALQPAGDGSVPSTASQS